jgi:hypothetical protein
LEENEIDLQHSSYEIRDIACGDTMATVEVIEAVSYNQKGITGSEQISHELTVMLHNNSFPVVAADGYKESFSDFESSSYVTPAEQSYTTNATTGSGGSPLCILNVAESQIGQGEEDPIGKPNQTKYGTEMGYPGQPWCVVFVSWCAKHANVDASIIKRHSNCDTLKKFFMEQESFRKSPAQGGDYTPVPGDIVFKGTDMSDSTHVGIVKEVVDGLVYMIDGNGTNNDVDIHSFSLTATNVLGYGHPDYENEGHTAASYVDNGNTHSGTCINCGISFTEEHKMSCSSDGTNHWDECVNCAHCENEEAHTCATYSKNLSEHWKVCSDCGTIYAKSLHIYLTMADGRKKCKTCGYITGGIEGGTIMSGFNCGE